MLFIRICEVGEMVSFIFGAVFGCFVGVFVTALCSAASKADEQSERFIEKNKKDRG